MKKFSCAGVVLTLMAGFSDDVKAAKDTMIVDYGKPTLVQRKTIVITPEKLYLLETFLDKGYPLAVSDTKKILPLILKTPQQKQQYFGTWQGGVSSLYSLPWVQSYSLRTLTRALCEYTPNKLPGREDDVVYELGERQEALLSAVDVWKIPLSLKPPRIIVDGRSKSLGILSYRFTRYPLSSLDSLTKAVDSLTAPNPELAVATKMRVRKIWQINSDTLKKEMKVSLGSDELKESPQTAALFTINVQQNKALLRELDLLKIDINKMFVDLKKSKKASTP